MKELDKGEDRMKEGGERVRSPIKLYLSINI